MGYTVFKNEATTRNYDLILITHESAAQILKEKVESGESTTITTIKDVMQLLDCSIDTALSVMGYMYQTSRLLRLSGTEYKFNF